MLFVNIKIILLKRKLLFNCSITKQIIWGIVFHYGTKRSEILNGKYKGIIVSNDIKLFIWKVLFFKIEKKKQYLSLVSSRKIALLSKNNFIFWVDYYCKEQEQFCLLLENGKQYHLNNISSMYSIDRNSFRELIIWSKKLFNDLFNLSKRS